MPRGLRGDSVAREPPVSAQDVEDNSCARTQQEPGTGV